MKFNFGPVLVWDSARLDLRAVCSEGWDDDDADVLCRFNGFTTGKAFHNSTFSTSNKRVSYFLKGLISHIPGSTNLGCDY